MYHKHLFFLENDFQATQKNVKVSPSELQRYQERWKIQYKQNYFYRLHSVITQQDMRNVSIDIIATLHAFLFFTKNYKGNKRASKYFKEIILNGPKFWKHIISGCDIHGLLRIFLRWGRHNYSLLANSGPSPVFVFPWAKNGFNNLND